MPAKKRPIEATKKPVPIFFASPRAFRTWLSKNHARETEVLAGFHKKETGKPTMTWPESVDEALCYGWIDGIRKSLGAEGYTIRFTPRKPRSNWSAVNIGRVAELTKEKRMQPAGLAAFEKRSEATSRIYSYEQRKTQVFLAEDEQRFRDNAQAWEFFQAQPPGYRHLMIFRVLDCKREETRHKRLTSLIDASAKGKRML